MLTASNPSATRKPVQVLDSVGEPVVVHVAERSAAAPALVVVHELKLVCPRVQGPHVSAAETGSAVEHDEGDALTDNGASDLDVPDGNSLARDVHDGLLRCGP